jgi:hypothetical protein
MRLSFRQRLQHAVVALLLHSKLPWILAAISGVLLLPTLWLGFHLDDYVHRYLFSHLPGAADLRRAYQSPFGIANGDVADNRWQAEQGYAPWWIHPRLLISLYRPLSEYSHAIDARFFADSPLLQHAHSVIWYLALVVAATALYRSVLGATTQAGLAALFYALDQTHGFAVGWIANRNAVLCAFFGVLSLLCHHRARCHEKRGSAVLAPFLLVAALLSGEGAIAVCGYLFAHALWLERGRSAGDTAPALTPSGIAERVRGGAMRRVFSLWPYALVVVGWRLGYHALGRGARFSGLYIDPLLEPLRFVVAVCQRAPLLLLGQLGMPPAETALFAPTAAAVAIGVLAVLVALGFAWVAWPLLRSNAVARFWGFGMAAALVPACTTHPNNRLLFFVGLGAMGLLSQLWHGLVERADWLPSSARWQRGASLFIAPVVGFHALISPLLLPLSACSIALTAPAEAAARSVLAQVDVRDIVIVNSPDYFFVKLVPVLAALEQRKLPPHLRAMSFGAVRLRILHPDLQTLVVEYEGGLLAEPLMELYRARDVVMARGTRVPLEGLEIKVTELTPDRRIAAARFRFESPLNPAHFTFLTWGGDGFHRFMPPPVGHVAVVEPAELHLGL